MIAQCTECANRGTQGYKRNGPFCRVRRGRPLIQGFTEHQVQQSGCGLFVPALAEPEMTPSGISVSDATIVATETEE